MANFSPYVTLVSLLTLAGTARGQAPTFALVTTASNPYFANPFCMVVADVNADNKPDLVFANYNGVNGQMAGVLLGTGTGSFGTLATYTTGPASYPYSIAVADVNGDSNPDLLTANYFNSTVGVLVGNGSGTFYSLATYPAGNTIGSGSLFPRGIAVADVNGDNKPDLLVVNSSGSAGAGVLLGNGNGTFQPVTTYATGGNQPRSIVVADVNSDGNPDLLLGNYSSNNVSVLLGTGTGSFGVAITYSTGAGSGPFGIAVADVNGDGKPDLLTANHDNGTVGLLLGTSTGSFGAVTTYSTGAGSLPYTVSVGDINGDGKRDLVTANFGSSTAGVFLGNGTGSFGAMLTYSINNPTSIAIADVNGDSRPDLCTTTSGGVSVLLNTTPLATRATLPGTTATLHPNPASTGAALHLAGLPAAVAQVQATLFDATGRAVGQQQLAAAQGAARADVPTAGLAAGLYVLRLLAYGAQGQPVGSLPAQRLSVR